MQEQRWERSRGGRRPSDLRRGDLIFWKGHVAIVRDRATLMHANAFHMAVAIEPIAKRSPAFAPPAASTSVRRLVVSIDFGRRFQ